MCGEPGALGVFWLAPMSNITDAPFRVIAREHGADLVFTEMLSSEALVRRDSCTLSMLKPDPRHGEWGAQIMGSDPRLIADAAKIAEQSGASLVDINMGCPVRKVVKRGAGAALMGNPRLAAAVVQAARKVVSIPLSVKLRAGWREPTVTALEVARIAEEEGVDLVIIHPRFAGENYSAPARWGLIAELKAQSTVPVVGSGDVGNATAAVNMLRETGCDAVLIARGALGNPWIFEKSKALLSGGESIPEPDPRGRLRVFLEHVDVARSVWSDSVVFHRMKKHLMWYSSGLAGSREFRKMVSRCADLEALVSLAERFFAGVEV